MITEEEFEKRLKRINPNLYIVEENAGEPLAIVYVCPDKSKQVVFDFTKAIWAEDDNHLNNFEHNELRDLLNQANAFTKGLNTFNDDSEKMLSYKKALDNPFKEYTDHLAEILQEKNSDYDNSFEQVVNELGKVVLLVRIQDKYKRAKKIILHPNKKQKVKDESLEDTLLDMAGYAILGLKYLKEHENES